MRKTVREYPIQGDMCRTEETDAPCRRKSVQHGRLEMGSEGKGQSSEKKGWKSQVATVINVGGAGEKLVCH